MNKEDLQKIKAYGLLAVILLVVGYLFYSSAFHKKISKEEIKTEVSEQFKETEIKAKAEIKQEAKQAIDSLAKNKVDSIFRDYRYTSYDGSTLRKFLKAEIDENGEPTGNLVMRITLAQLDSIYDREDYRRTQFYKDIKAEIQIRNSKE